MLQGGLKTWARHLVLAAVLAGLGLQASPARAAAPSLSSCLGLWRDLQSAQSKGVEELMAPGPAGARERLSAAQLNEIKSYISTLERLKFRCRNFIAPPPGAAAP